jgi:NAD(P)-dependent dehydrogenase (short-subunit alcohol dehydrogenase family)
VIITSSVAGLGIGTIGANGTYGYSASKAAVLHLGRNLAIELGPRHITVNSICPGFFPSKMANGLLEIAGGADKMAASNPMKRLGRPEDIAGAVVYLASRAGSHVNGEFIAIDGGAMWARGELASPGESKL